MTTTFEHHTTNNQNIMGDRANIIIEGDGDMFPAPVYFYTHGRGSEIKRSLQATLRRKQRWDDHPYLARMIFCDLIGDYAKESTGFGISTRIGDGARNLLCVNMQQQMVRKLDSPEDINAPVAAQWTFEEFCALELGDD